MAYGTRILFYVVLVGFWAGPLAAQPVVPPFSAPNQTLSTLQSELLYTVDLGALPLRPRLIVEATPDLAHPDLELEVRISGCSLSSGGGFCPPSVVASGVGAQRAVYEPFACEVRDEFVGETCEVSIRPLAFGALGKPASVDVAIRGETRVPTGTVEIGVDAGVQTLSSLASKDTTLYQANTSASNGLGESIWVSSGTGTNAMHGLLDFPVVPNLPPDVWIENASLNLSVLSASPGATLALHSVPTGLLWSEGSSNAVGDESIPPAPTVGPHASWSFRRWTIFLVNPGPWQTPGGDRSPTPLATGTVSDQGFLSLSSPALLEHVRALQAGTATSDGFLLVPVSGSARFGSAENASFSNVPQFVVTYREAPIQSFMNVGTMNFFNEGQNFRWIYDIENDYEVMGQAGTACVALNPFTASPIHNYTHQYRGSPSYRGLDCCTWQIGSTIGVQGTGQAIFYIGIDPEDPANDPGDADGDGIMDVCDNCLNVPNGPLSGSCLEGPRQGQFCLSDQECLNDPCSLAQQDIDRDGVGDACVPEPGIAGMIGSGVLWMAARARSRRR